MAEKKCGSSGLLMDEGSEVGIFFFNLLLGNYVIVPFLGTGSSGLKA